MPPVFTFTVLKTSIAVLHFAKLMQQKTRQPPAQTLRKKFFLYSQEQTEIKDLYNTGITDWPTGWFIGLELRSSVVWYLLTERLKARVSALSGDVLSLARWKRRGGHDGYRDAMIKKEKKIFLIYKEIQMGSSVKSYMRKGFLIHEEFQKYLVISEEAVSHIWPCTESILMRKVWFSFLPVWKL
jgi:hypothetical protein